MPDNCNVKFINGTIFIYSQPVNSGLKNNTKYNSLSYTKKSCLAYTVFPSFGKFLHISHHGFTWKQALHSIIFDTLKYVV